MFPFLVLSVPCCYYTMHPGQELLRSPSLQLHSTTYSRSTTRILSSSENVLVL